MDEHEVAITAALDRVPALHDRLAAAAVEPGSDAAIDAELPLGRLAWNGAADGASVAVDHLGTWGSLWAPCEGHRTIHVHSHFTLLRAAAEGAVQTRWLLDPAIDATKRRRRAIRLQCADHLERHLFEDAGRKDNIPRDPALGGRSALYRLAELRRGARLIGEGMHRPTDTTGMFRDYARFGARRHAGEALYRLLSALAHGKPWARVPASEHLALHQQPSGYQRMLAEAHMPTAAWTTEIVVRLTERALTDLERYGRAGAGGLPTPADRPGGDHPP